MFVRRLLGRFPRLRLVIAHLGTPDHDAFKGASDNAQQQINRLLSVKGHRGIREIHRELGRILWDDVGMARTEQSLKRALEAIPKLRDDFWQNVSVPGTPDNLPLVGRWQLDGLLLAGGHYRNGILLAPLTAEAIAETLAGGEPEGPISFADPGRAASAAGAR